MPSAEAAAPPPRVQRADQREPAHDLQPIGWSAASLALLTAALWGGTSVAVRYASETLPPLAISGLRFSLAIPFMVAWMAAGGESLRLVRSQFGSCLIAGVLLFLQIGTFTAGVAYSNAMHASLLINLYPCFAYLIDVWLLSNSRASLRTTIGMAAALCGAVFVVFAQEAAAEPPSLAGDALLLLSAAIMGVKVVFVKRAVRTVSPGSLMLWHNVVGTLLFAVSSWAFETVAWSDFTTAAVLSLLYQGLAVAGLCYAIQAHLLRRHSATQISAFAFATPLFGVLLAVLLRGESLTLQTLLASAAIAAGVYLISTSPTRPRPS